MGCAVGNMLHYFEILNVKLFINTRLIYRFGCFMYYLSLNDITFSSRRFIALFTPYDVCSCKKNRIFGSFGLSTRALYNRELCVVAVGVSIVVCAHLPLAQGYVT